MMTDELQTRPATFRHLSVTKSFLRDNADTLYQHPLVFTELKICTFNAICSTSAINIGRLHCLDQFFLESFAENKLMTKTELNSTRS